MKYPKYNEKHERRKQILAEEKPAREKRVIVGAQYSDDHGKTWDKIAICIGEKSCYKPIEPPNRVVREIESGVRFCDWCGAENVNL